jgi:sugar phosphate isomerase/epimerase
LAITNVIQVEYPIKRMDIGVSIGPYLDRIESLPSSFAFVEYGLGEGEVTLDTFEPSEVSDRLDEAGFRRVVHLPYKQPLSTPVDRIDTATFQYLDDVLAVAAQSGVETAVAHPSARGGGHSFEQLTSRISALSECADSHDITLCLETVGYAGGLALDRVGRVVDQANANVCLDIGYAYLEDGVGGIREFLESYGDIVAHLHVHGARHRGDTHIPVGSGDVAYEEIGPIVSETVSEPSATVEVFTDDTDHLKNSAERFRATLTGDRDG